LIPFDVVIPDAEQGTRLYPKKLKARGAGASLAWAVARVSRTGRRDGLGTPDEVLKATARNTARSKKRTSRIHH